MGPRGHGDRAGQRLKEGRGGVQASCVGSERESAQDRVAHMLRRTACRVPAEPFMTMTSRVKGRVERVG